MSLADLAAAWASPLGRKYYLFGLRVRLRARLRRYDLCHATDAMALFAARGFAARGVPVLLDVNEIPDPFERQGRHFIATPAAAKRHLARAFARDIAGVRAVIATSDSMADVVKERFGRRAIAIRNARLPFAGPPGSAIRADLAAGPEVRILVYPCTAAPHLGVETALEVLSRLPDSYRLVFVGHFVNEAYRETVLRLVRRLGLEARVLLKGELPDPDYLPYIAGADIGLVPLDFTYRNQRVVLPWRVIDLAAAAVPMVATPSDEICRIARTCDIGEIAAGAGPGDVLAAVRRLEAAPPARLATIRRDLARLAARFSPPRQQRRYRWVVRRLVGRRLGRAAFVVNLALRNNRRIIGFIDELSELGWQVDLYCVRPPASALFRHPERLRFIPLSDRLLPAAAIAAWRRVMAAAGTARKLPPVRWVEDGLVGVWFGARQLYRALRLARAVGAARRRGGPWDIVIASDLFALPAGLWAARGARLLVYDANEIPDLRQRTSPYLRRIPAALRLPFRLAERAYVARAGLVLAASHALARYLRRRYRPFSAPRIVAVRNGAEFDRDTVGPPSEVPALRQRLGLAPGDRILVSPCGISAETGALIAAGALRFLPADHILVFIGRFSTRGTAAAIDAVLRRDRTQHRCFFLGEAEYRAYLRDLAQCDIGLVLFDPAIANLRLAAPNRFFDLIAMGVPIVATALEEVAPILRRTGTGIVVGTRRPAAVARAVLALEARLGMAAGGRPDRGAEARLARLARFLHGDKERARLLTALEAAAGPLAGKRIALMTLRSAASNRRFLRLGAALVAAGTRLDAFDTDIGAPIDAPERPPWLNTLPVVRRLAWPWRFG